MEYQSFSINGLKKVVRKSDFQGVLKDDQEEYRELLLENAYISAKENFPGLINPLSSFRLNGNLVFKLDEHYHRIIERKLTSNLRKAWGNHSVNRDDIIENLKSLLKEDVPFKIYRWDIKKFYESFDNKKIDTSISNSNKLSPKTKLLLNSVLKNHRAKGGTGCPRGLSISSVITDFLMVDFDYELKNHNDTFFYSRYVDDIIIITSGNEDSQLFQIFAKKNLPIGLVFNDLKSKSSPKIGTAPKGKLQNDDIQYSFEYLGYKLGIKRKTDDRKHRVVDIDISDKKYIRYKHRISRAFYEFSKDSDEDLLIDRIRYLTNNFKVFNPNIERSKLSGIYYNYPAICGDSKNIVSLDNFLKTLTISKKGRLGKIVGTKMTTSLKSKILSNSFIKGHNEKIFVHFTSRRISQIKKCWNH